MKKSKTSYKIENKIYSFAYYGKTFMGKNEVLLNNQDNLLENVNFNDKGFNVVNFGKSISHNSIKTFIENFIKKLIRKYSKKKINNFKLEKYHLFVDLKLHYKIIKEISKGIRFSKSISKNKL